MKKLVAYYTIAGGLLGAYISISSILSIDTSISKSLFFCLFAILYLASVVVAIFFIRKRQYLLLMIVFQAIQILGISEFGFKYVFCSGAALKIGYQEGGFYTVIDPLSAEFLIALNSNPSFIYVNIVPVLFIIILSTGYNNNKE